MNLQQAKKAVEDWLWQSKVRKTVGAPWDDDYLTDAAQMLMEAHCKIEQLEVAHKSLTEEGPLYEKLQSWIRKAPLTWLPGLLGTIVGECIKRNVFKHDVSKAVAGMESTWRREKAAFPELQEGLKRTAGK